MNSRTLSAFVVSLLLGARIFAGQPIIDDKGSKTMKEPCPPDTMTWLSIRSSYTGNSDFERGHDTSGDSFYKGAQVSQRIPLNLFGGWPNVECGRWYLRLGAAYDRWDFDNSGGLPIPNTLQSFYAVIALEYVVSDAVAIDIEAQPGFFFEHDLRADSFNVPILAYAPVWRHEGDQLSWTLLAGVSYNELRSYPVIPAVGISATYGKWTLLALPPQPRLIYSATEQLSLWLEGEVAGGSFRTDSHDYKRQENLDHAVVTYSEWRASLGLTWKPCANAVVDIGAGYAFKREFDFHRADEAFKSDEGAPFVKAELRASF